MAKREQKSIFVTGAGSGIGRATAQLFAERGWFVGLADINAAGLEETAASLPDGQRLSLTLDVRDRAAWARAMDTFGQVTNRRLNVLFNNAGVGHGGLLEDMDEDAIDLVIDVNLRGVINGVRAALPLLRETAGARIVNTASAAALVGAPHMSVYCASKFALRGLTEALDLECARYGVRVTSLMPWFIDTPLLDASLRAELNTKKVAIYPPRRAAERAWDAAHGADTHYTVGKETERLAFMARFFPDAARRLGKKLAGE